MSKQPTTVLLRNLDSHGHSKPFAPDHAERLLAYPNSRWVKVAEDAPAPKPEAAAVKKKPAAAADSPAPDATGLPTSL